MQTQRKDLPTLWGRGSTSNALAGEAGVKGPPVRPKYRGMFSGMAMIVREEGIKVRKTILPIVDTKLLIVIAQFNSISS